MPYDLKKGRTDFQAVPKDVKEDEQSMLNAVKVTNISNLGHSDTLQFYFENARKSGGGTIVNFEVHEEDDFALVTFQEEKGNCSPLDGEDKCTDLRCLIILIVLWNYLAAYT